MDDPLQKVGFSDDVWLVARGGEGDARATDEAVYVAIAVRNVGTGIAVLHGWHLYPELQLGADMTHTPLADFTMLTRDLYVAPDDVGFWQGAFRDPSSESYRDARRAVEAPQRMTVDILYGDFEGGQRVITRFLLTPHESEDEVALARVGGPPLEHRQAGAARARGLGASADAPTDGKERRQLRRFFWSGRRGLAPASLRDLRHVVPGRGRSSVVADGYVVVGLLIVAFAAFCGYATVLRWRGSADQRVVRSARRRS